MTPLNSTRGNRATCGILDEFRQNMSRISEKVEFFIRKTHLLLERFRLLSQEEVEKIGKIKFEEWNIQDYSSIKISFAYNGKWRN